MGLGDIEARLPPGFRFYPSDEELVCHYLRRKILEGEEEEDELLKATLVDIDLHTCEPWQLPEAAKVNWRGEWYFFSYRDRKYATGMRRNRATRCGYWKATGKDRMVFDERSGAIAGMRKTLVFYRNRAPLGLKTDWIMHEFRLHTPHLSPKEDWVLCRVFHKSKGEEDVANSLHQHHQHPQESITTTAPAAVSLPVPAISYYHHHHHHHQISNDGPESSSGTDVRGRSGSNDGVGCDDFGFFWDLSFEQSNNVIPNAAEMIRFDNDHDNMILL